MAWDAAPGGRCSALNARGSVLTARRAVRDAVDEMVLVSVSGQHCRAYQCPGVAPWLPPASRDLHDPASGARWEAVQGEGLLEGTRRGFWASWGRLGAGRG